MCLFYYITLLRLKSKGIPLYTMKAYRGSGAISPLILNLSTRCRWMVDLTPQLLYPCWKKPLYTLKGRLGGPQNLSVCFGEYEIQCWALCSLQRHDIYTKFFYNQLFQRSKWVRMVAWWLHKPRFLSFMKEGWLKIVMHMINFVSFSRLIKYRLFQA